MFRKILFILCVVFSLHANENEVIQKWLQANDTFKSAQTHQQYLEAASIYEEIIESGVRNGHVYYNLGNAYFKADRLDYAILNYKRATIYIAEDPYLVENLKLATTKLQQKIQFQKPKQQSTLQYLFFWHFNWKYDTRLLLFILTYTFFWLLLIVRLQSRKIPFWNLMIPTTVILLALGSSVLYDYFVPKHDAAAILVGKNIEVRKGDAVTYELLYGEQEIPGGVEVRVVEERNNWSKIEFPDRLHGWVKNNFIKKIYDKH